MEKSETTAINKFLSINPIGATIIVRDTGYSTVSQDHTLIGIIRSIKVEDSPVRTLNIAVDLQDGKSTMTLRGPFKESHVEILRDDKSQAYITFGQYRAFIDKEKH